MPAAHYLHPDFGLLCPTPRFRRKARIAVGCLVVALIGGTVLKAIHSPPRAPTALDTTAAVGDAGEVPAMMLAAPPAVTGAVESSAGRASCEQDNSTHRTWPYLDDKCAAGKARKPRAVRAATNPPALAAIALGRPSALLENAQAPAPAVSLPVQGQAERSAVIPPAIAAAEASHRPATMSKKAKKVARREKGRRDPSSHETLWWREVRADSWGVGYGGADRDYGRSGYARGGFFGDMR